MLVGANDVDQTEDSYAGLNLLMVHVFGPAFYFSANGYWVAVGDAMAHLRARRRSSGREPVRAFLKDLGYRAAAE